MNVVDQATRTQLANVQAKTGLGLEALLARIEGYGLEKHGQLLARIKEDLGLGHGDANLLAHVFRARDAAPAPQDPVTAAVEAIYAGKKADLRPLHDAVMASIATLGPLEVAPKKAYLSLRRAKQFAMVGPGTKGRLEVGLNLKGAEAGDRLEVLPPGGMCQARVFLTDAEQVDDELMGWVRAAYDAAG
jgi:hypothetical protein